MIVVIVVVVAMGMNDGSAMRGLVAGCVVVVGVWGEMPPWQLRVSLAGGMDANDALPPYDNCVR